MGRVIRELRPTQRDPGRVTVRVGWPAAEGRRASKGRVVATLPVERAQELRLEPDLAWTAALAEAVTRAAGHDRAFRSACNRIGSRAMSRGMLADRLRRAGHEPEAVGSALDRVGRLGLLDDAAFARALVRETLRAKPAGERLLRQKLMEKRVPRGVADAVLAEHRDDRKQRAEAGEDVDAEAIAFAVKKASTPSMQRLDPQARRRRLQGQLARRGFGFGVIDRALREALHPTGDG
ncbi:regulatory protein RecX [Phycisphaera mikurensis NBRC 102666]|uniref:Regulatory protein RecX n=1 Tax=Phycisphaera mikurensis (strain NBRC 102666 / KCTC 22515 / FYK2301M01) TaxID=1142394 RepID=I0IJC1_PHYMF|nr:regulatory protein RecX [Phycisphaera mikurensis NBRC 102666]